MMLPAKKPSNLVYDPNIRLDSSLQKQFHLKYTLIIHQIFFDS
jgi:hypothetical protein